MNKSGLKARRYGNRKAYLLSQSIKAQGLKLLYVYEKSDGWLLTAYAGAFIGTVIEEMVKLADGVKDEVPYAEAELNSKIVRAYAGDHPPALFLAWERAPWDGPDVVTLRTDEWERDDAALAKIEPRNNDGRETCFWCGASTREIQLATSTGSICTQCGR